MVTEGGAAAGPGKETSGLAVVSLVLGIFSLLCGWMILGLPAVICGHLGRSAIRRSNGRLTGSGAALAGIILGYLSILLTVAVVVVAARRWKHIRQRGARWRDFAVAGRLQVGSGSARGRLDERILAASPLARECVSRLKEVGLASAMYASDHDGVLAPDLDALRLYVHDVSVFCCPAVQAKGAGFARGNVAGAKYLYFGKGGNLEHIRDASRAVLASDRPGNHAGYVHLLFADGHVTRFRLRRGETIQHLVARNGLAFAGADEVFEIHRRGAP